MSDDNTDSSKLSKSGIVEKYNSNASDLAKIAISVHINKEVAVKDSEESEEQGNCWLINKANNSDNKIFLLPKKGYKFATSHFSILQTFFDLEEYQVNISRNFILKEPAQVSYTGKDWKLYKKGILNFANNSSLSSSADSEKTSEQDKSEIYEKEREIKRLNEQIEELNQQLEQERENNRHSNDREVNNQSESIEQLLQKQQIEFSTQLKSFKRSILSEIGDRTPHQFNFDSGDIKQLVRDGISEYFQQELDKHSLSINFLIKEELGKYIQNDLELHLPFHQQQIKEKIVDSIFQENNNRLKNLQDAIVDIKSNLQSIFNKIQEKQTYNSTQLTSESHEQLNLIEKKLKRHEDSLEYICKSIHYIKQQIEYISQQQKVDDDINSLYLEPSHTNKMLLLGEANSEEDFSYQITPIYNLEDSESLIDTYNSNPETLSNNVIKVAATKESIEQRRTGKQTQIIFTKISNESCWIIQEFSLQNGYLYLVPKANLIINDPIYQTIEDIFVCQGYHDRTSNQFSLVNPAIVKSDSENENEWQLIQPGELIFS